MQSPEHIAAWEQARILAQKIYEHFGISFDIEFENQICTTALSLSNALAQSLEEKEKGELRRVLLKAKGYCNDIEAMLRSGIKLKKITPEKVDILTKECHELSELIRALMKKYG